MHVNAIRDYFVREPGGSAIRAVVYRMAPAGGRGKPNPEEGPSGRSQTAGEDLPYKVELWDETRASVEQVLAVTANGSIGFAAFYAATREFPERYITLRHNNSIVSRWNGPRH